MGRAFEVVRSDHFEEVIGGGAGAIGGGGQQDAASNETAAAAIASFTIFMVLGLLGGSCWMLR